MSNLSTKCLLQLALILVLSEQIILLLSRLLPDRSVVSSFLGVIRSILSYQLIHFIMCRVVSCRVVSSHCLVSPLVVCYVVLSPCLSKPFVWSSRLVLSRLSSLVLSLVSSLVSRCLLRRLVSRRPVTGTSEYVVHLVMSSRCNRPAVFSSSARLSSCLASRLSRTHDCVGLCYLVF